MSKFYPYEDPKPGRNELARKLQMLNEARMDPRPGRPMPDEIEELPTNPIQRAAIDDRYDAIVKEEDDILGKLMAPQRERLALEAKAEEDRKNQQADRQPASQESSDAEEPRFDASMVADQQREVGSALQDVYGAELSDEALKSAQKHRRDTDLLAAIVQAGDKAASAISEGNYKGDPKSGEAIKLIGGRPVTDIEEGRAAKDKELSYGKTKLSLSEQIEKSDPNSPRSKKYVELAESLFTSMGNPIKLTGLSEAQLEDRFGTLEKLASAQQLKKAREDLAVEKKAEKLKDNVFKYTSTLMKELDKSTKSHAGALHKAESFLSLVNEAKISPSAMNDLGLTYQVAKLLDPDSAVREGELKLLGLTGDLLTRAQRVLTQLSTGTVWTAQDLRQLKDLGQAIYDDKKRQYDRAAAPVYRKGLAVGVPAHEYDPYALEDKMKAELEEAKKEKANASKIASTQPKKSYADELAESKRIASLPVEEKRALLASGETVMLRNKRTNKKGVVGRFKAEQLLSGMPNEYERVE